MTSALQLKPVFTTAGLAAMQAVHRQGLAVKISHVALGDALYDIRDLAGTPLETARAMVALQHEQLRVPVGPLSSTQANQVVVQAEVSAGDPPFWIGEVGFVTDTGVLLAVWSAGTGPLGWRSVDVPWLIKFVLAWTDLPANSISVVMPEDGAALTALAISIGRLEGKVRHTVEVGGGLEYDEVNNTQLTEAIGNMADARMDVVMAVIDEELERLRAKLRHTIAAAGGEWADGDETLLTAALGALLAPKAALAATQSWLKAQRSTPVAIDDAAPAVDLSASNVFYWSLGGGRVLPAPIKVGPGQSGVIWLHPNSNTLAYNTFWRFPSGILPVLSSAAGAVDALVYEVNETGAWALCALVKDGR